MVERGNAVIAFGKGSEEKGCGTVVEGFWKRGRGRARRFGGPVCIHRESVGWIWNIGLGTDAWKDSCVFLSYEFCANQWEESDCVDAKDVKDWRLHV